MRGKEAGLIPLSAYPKLSVLPYVTVALVLINGIAFLYTGTFPTSTHPDDVVWLDARPWLEVAPDLEWPPGFDPRLYQALARGRGYDYPVTERTHLYVRYGLIPVQFWRGEDLPPTIGVPIWVTLFTSMFLHGGLFHLLGNMLYLWIFGGNVEAAMGRVRFVVFYILCGLGAALLQMAVYPRGAMPMVGASGAIAGVMGAYLVLFPWSRVLTLIPIFYFFHLVQVPAIVVLGLWFLIQFFSGLMDLSAVGGVAWFAHLGGFVSGALLVLAFKRRGLEAGLLEWWRRRSLRRAMGPWEQW